MKSGDVSSFCHTVSAVAAYDNNGTTRLVGGPERSLANNNGPTVSVAVEKLAGTAVVVCVRADDHAAGPNDEARCSVLTSGGRRSSLERQQAQPLLLSLGTLTREIVLAKMSERRAVFMCYTDGSKGKAGGVVCVTLTVSNEMELTRGKSARRVVLIGAPERLALVAMGTGSLLCLRGMRSVMSGEMGAVCALPGGRDVDVKQSGGGEIGGLSIAAVGEDGFEDHAIVCLGSQCHALSNSGGHLAVTERPGVLVGG